VYNSLDVWQSKINTSQITRGVKMAQITGGELLLRCLHAERVRFIHAITDGTYMMVLEALERLGDELDMRLIVPRHEAAAAHIADGYTRVTGEPAVVMACAGPGAANLISGIICAQGEGSPVVAITTTRRSEIGDAYVHLGGSQVIDHRALFRPAVKWSGKVEHWQRIPDVVRHAFRVATSGRAGPTHVLIPEEILNQRGDEESAQVWQPERYRVTGGRSADPALVRQAAEMLVEAEMVNVHCGTGAHRSGAGSQVRALAEYLGAVVTSGANSRGIVPDDHELVLHRLCMASFMAHNQADAILVVGSRLGELHMWGKPPLWGDPAKQRTIQIDVDPRNVGLNRPVDVALIGDAKTVLAQLLEAVQELTPARAPSPKLAMLRGVQDGWRKELDEAISDMERTPMLTGQILKVCNDFFPPDAITVLDGGNTSLWSTHYHVARAERSLLHALNMGYLGTGLPYAIGAKLAAPDRPVYCISGDSAFGFNIQELETAVRNELNVIVIVAVDGAYGMEKSAQKRMFGRQADWFGHDHAPVRYDQVAVAMGCHGEYVEKGSQVRAALERAVASGKPSVIHAAVDPVANVDPPGISVWIAARSGQISL
jgi:acetolactate synthase-1/2/3 large subunit